MARVLVHLVSGPEHPTRAALALLVARTAAEEGHDVRLFLAGDAVQLVRAATADAVQGVGLGNVGEHLGALRASGAPVLASRMSIDARGIEPDEGIEVARPQDLVESAVWAETVMTY